MSCTVCTSRSNRLTAKTTSSPTTTRSWRSASIISPSTADAWVHEILTHNIVNRLSKAKPKAGMGKVPADILAEFFAGGIISLIKWWLLEEPNYTEEDLKQQLSTLAEITLCEYCA